MHTLINNDFSSRKAIIRVDFNVPLDENFHVTDSTRILAAKESIDYISVSYTHLRAHET